MADLSDVTALASVGVAALAVLMGPVTARVSYRWNERSDRERWEREQLQRRLGRGEEAARDLLTVVDQVDLLMRETPKEPERSEVRPAYYSIRRLAESITSDEARDKLFEVARGYYFWGQAEHFNPELTRWSVAYACSEAAHRVIRAYQLGRPIPATPRLDKLMELIDEAGDIMWDPNDALPDPLGPGDEQT